MKSLTLPVIPSVQYKITTACSIALLKRPGSLIIADKITSRSLLTWSRSKARSVVVMIQIIPCLPGGRAESYNAVLRADRKTNRRHEKMGAERNASVAQIAIAWAIAKGTLPSLVRLKSITFWTPPALQTSSYAMRKSFCWNNSPQRPEWIHEAPRKNRWCKARPEQTVMNDTHERAVPGDSNLYHFYCFV